MLLYFKFYSLSIFYINEFIFCWSYSDKWVLMFYNFCYTFVIYWYCFNSFYFYSIIKANLFSYYFVLSYIFIFNSSTDNLSLTFSYWIFCFSLEIRLIFYVIYFYAFKFVYDDFLLISYYFWLIYFYFYSNFFYFYLISAYFLSA